uniref:BTB domain-containing protein n=2 Tax=Poecilia TaxID=8080 RepID=A0A096MCK8_POEFO
MWCYQKPGFEALIVAELRKQQQCSQFCDTLLKAGGVSVPAHSCILSAISPHISSALSSSPAPPSGQSRLLEFQALGACTLLHIIRLLYSGEMAGEGENEKQEAIYAAAKLGISGLV